MATNTNTARNKRGRRSCSLLSLCLGMSALAAAVLARLLAHELRRCPGPLARRRQLCRHLKGSSSSSSRRRQQLRVELRVHLPEKAVDG